MVKNVYAHYYVSIISALFCIATVTASDNPVVSFVSKQNRDRVGAIIASIINKYIGRKSQTIVYCTRQKSFSLVEDESHARGKGHLQYAPNFKITRTESTATHITIEYTKEVIPEIRCASGVVISPSDRALLSAAYEIGTPQALIKRKNRSIATQWIRMTNKDLSNSGKEERNKRIMNIRKIFGNECVPSSLTESNSDVWWAYPYLLTCQNEKLKIFRIKEGKVSALEVHRRVNEIFSEISKK